jgi:pimeloyl-ACP methyl ester carboxylesterase
MIVRIVTFAAISVGIYFAIALGLIVSQRPGKLAGEGGLDFTTLTGRETGEPAALQSYRARDGAELSYRSYASGRDDAPLLVFVHGSGWHSLGYDGLARSIAESGAADVVLPDLRGHGDNPERRGDIDYIGQFEDDLADLIGIVRKSGQKLVIGGHSSGGGLAIRFAGGAYGEMVDGAVLFAPYLHYKAPTVRPNSGGWAYPLTRRIIGLTMLNNVGITALNGLPAIRFAFPQSVLDGPLGETATAAYSFRLNTSYAPRDDYKTDIATLPPFLLVAGSDDEAFVASKFEPVMSAANPNGRYLTIDGISHLGVIDAPQSAEAIRVFLKNI